MKKVAVIGLDGMSWTILDRLFNWKVMPNLEKIALNSLRGVLRSTIPPESGPAWTSIATGVNPGKHGIFGFTKPTADYDDTVIMSSRDVQYLRVHEMVALQGLKSVCVNQLLTYPIKRIPGSFVITDWLSPEIKYSPEIEQYAKNFCGPTLGKPLPLIRRNWDSEYSDVSSRVDTINKLLQEVDWNLFWAVYSEPDHLFLRFFDMVMKRDERLTRLLTKIDETFGIVKDFADLLIVVSDHGFGKYSQGIYPNTFLERQGLVRKMKRRRMKEIVCQRQVDEPRAKFLLPEPLYKYLSAMPSQVERLFLKIYKQLVKADLRVKLTTHVDPRRSLAFAHGFGIFVKRKELIDYIVSILKNEEFIGGVWKKDEIYTGKQLKAMPDLIIIPNFKGNYALRGDVIAPKTVVRRNFASHNPDGIVIINKSGLQPSWTKSIKIYDIVPTVLDFLGLEIPEDTDGKVIDLMAN